MSQATFPIRRGSMSEPCYWTFKDIKPDLFKLYSGNDPQFNAMTCVACAMFSNQASECRKCQRLTCSDCRQTRGGK